MLNPYTWTTAKVTSTDIDKAYGPDGLGLNILRFMVYPSTPEFSNDIPRIKQAQSLGAILLGTPWNAPSDMRDADKWMLTEKLPDYASHLRDMVAYLKLQGVSPDILSIQNEPDITGESWNRWTATQIVDFLAMYPQSYFGDNLQIMTPETMGFNKNYYNLILSKPEALEHIDVVGFHIYGTPRYTGFTYNTAVQKGKELWMTEHLYNDDATEPGKEKPVTNSVSGFDWEWIPSLERVGKDIHYCMTNNHSAYIYWYLKRYYGLVDENAESSKRGDGKVRSLFKESEPTYRAYILSHYAKYATGKTRIDISTSENTENLFVTAYLSNDKKEIALIVLNVQLASRNIEFTLPGTITGANAQSSSKTAGMMKDVEVRLVGNKTKAQAVIDGYSITSIRIVF
ncbi:MAG: hypothetical protein LBU44_03790 [Mediterranea sp.]|jgi:glucuronoarabinoxylan endo-1,4-beta-xylanase|nr:hypothetical protein [Mediterranea sp.]